jgi:hypothetical protein
MVMASLADLHAIAELQHPAGLVLEKLTRPRTPGPGPPGRLLQLEAPRDASLGRPRGPRPALKRPHTNTPAASQRNHGADNNSTAPEPSSVRDPSLGLFESVYPGLSVRGSHNNSPAWRLPHTRFSARQILVQPVSSQLRSQSENGAAGCTHVTAAASRTTMPTSDPPRSRVCTKHAGEAPRKTPDAGWASKSKGTE